MIRTPAQDPIIRERAAPCKATSCQQAGNEGRDSLLLRGTEGPSCSPGQSVCEPDLDREIDQPTVCEKKKRRCRNV